MRLVVLVGPLDGPVPLSCFFLRVDFDGQSSAFFLAISAFIASFSISFERSQSSIQCRIPSFLHAGKEQFVTNFSRALCGAPLLLPRLFVEHSLFSEDEIDNKPEPLWYLLLFFLSFLSPLLPRRGPLSMSSKASESLIECCTKSIKSLRKLLYANSRSEPSRS